MGGGVALTVTHDEHPKLVDDILLHYSLDQQIEQLIEQRKAVKRRISWYGRIKLHFLRGATIVAPEVGLQAKIVISRPFKRDREVERAYGPFGSEAIKYREIVDQTLTRLMSFNLMRRRENPLPRWRFLKATRHQVAIGVDKLDVDIDAKMRRSEAEAVPDEVSVAVAS